MTVYITVERSTRAPRFDDLPYNDARVDENIDMGAPIFTVSAHDPDLQGDIMFEIVGDYPAPSFFEMKDQISGDITLKKDLFILLHII